MPDPDYMPERPSVPDWVRETFKPTEPQELPDFGERFKELERKIRELEPA